MLKQKIKPEEFLEIAAREYGENPGYFDTIDTILTRSKAVADLLADHKDESISHTAWLLRDEIETALILLHKALDEENGTGGREFFGKGK